MHSEPRRPRVGVPRVQEQHGPPSALPGHPPGLPHHVGHPSEPPDARYPRPARNGRRGGLFEARVHVVVVQHQEVEVRAEHGVAQEDGGDHRDDHVERGANRARLAGAARHRGYKL